MNGVDLAVAPGIFVRTVLYILQSIAWVGLIPLIAAPAAVRRFRNTV